MRAAIATLSLALLITSCGQYTPPPAIPAGSWTLEACIGVTGMGCGSGRLFVYPDKATCFEALNALHTGDQPIAESNLKRNTFATCRPALPDDNRSRG